MKRRDLLLIGGIVLIALALLLFLQLGKKPGAEVIIRVDGQEQGRYSLSADGTYSLNGGTNLLRIENGKAQGQISRTNETITCLPNKLTVTVSGGENFAEIVG